MRSVALSAAIVLIAGCASILSAQDKPVADLPVAAPNLLLLVHQEVPSGRSKQREKLEENISRACDRLDTPSFWINLQSLSNPGDSYFFDPFDTFDQLEQSRAAWGRFDAAHPDLSHVQDEIDGLVGTQHTTFAIRRPDLGYLTETIDLSKTRFMRVMEVHLFPGRENDFFEGLKLLADAHTRVQAEVAWEVYEVHYGMARPTFFIFMPLLTLAQNDDILVWEQDMANQDGGTGLDRLKEIARDSYASSETTLYQVRPDMSHVSSEFADSDPLFWKRSSSAAVKPDKNLYVKPAKRSTSEKHAAGNPPPLPR